MKHLALLILMLTLGSCAQAPALLESGQCYDASTPTESPEGYDWIECES